MHALKSTLFARASLGAIAVAAAVSASPVSAQTVAANVFGGGATLPSATLRNLFDCYATPPGADPSVALPSGCNSGRLNTTSAFAYASVGSGGGQRGFASQDPTKAATFNQPSYPDVDFAVSDSFLSSTQLGVYNNGGTFSSTGPINLADSNDNCVTPATGVGQDAPFPGASTTYPPCYDNPRTENGPLIQIPLLGTGVVVAFDPIYRSVRSGGVTTNYRFNYTPRATNDAGGLNLSIEQLCRIFSGQYNDWSQITVNGVPVYPGVSTLDGSPDPTTAPLPLQLVFRDDDSGTTNIFINGLRDLCGSEPYSDGTVDSFPSPSSAGVRTGNFTTVFDTVAPTTQRYPGSISTGIVAGNTTACPIVTNSVLPPTTTPPPPGPGPVYRQARGNEGVATCLNTDDVSNQNPSTTNGRIGYLSTDFTVPYVDAAPYAGFRIVSADIQNPLRSNLSSENTYIQATPTSIGRALEFTNTDPTNRLANLLTVIPDTASNYNISSYPISGASYLLLYTCYDSTAETLRFVNNTGDAAAPTSNPIGFLNYYYASRDALRVSNAARADVRRLVEQGGFATPPRNARQFIVDNYLQNLGNFDTQIRSVTDSSAAGVCTGDLTAN